MLTAGSGKGYVLLRDTGMVSPSPVLIGRPVHNR